MSKKTFYIKGMHCPSCEILVKDKFKELKNVQEVNADFRKQEADVIFSGELTKQEINQVDYRLRNFGYQIVGKPSQENDPLTKKLTDAVSIAIILFVLFFFAQELNLIPSFDTASGLTLTTVFILGMIASTSTCMATSGALYLATIGKLNKSTFLSALSFNFGRILSYGFFGFVFGLIGKTIAVNFQLSAFLTLVISIAMVLIGLDMLKIISFSSLSLGRYTASLFEKLERRLLKNPHKTSFFLGSITYFLPCGFTQTVQLYGISLADPLKSSIIMMIFALGTTPILMMIGFLSSLTKSKYYLTFQKVIAVLIVMIGVYYLSNFLGIYGVNFNVFATKQAQINNVEMDNGVQVLRMNVDSSGYSPNFFTVQKNIPVKWLIIGEDVYGCQGYFIVPSLGYQKTLQPGENKIEFTSKEAGTINFSCGMGMFRGQIEVI